MKLLKLTLALAGAWAALAATAQAQTAGPRYVKKAVFVRLHYHESFRAQWGGNSKQMLDSYFTALRNAYQRDELQKIEIIRINDDPDQSPMYTYLDTRASEAGGNRRLLDAMETSLGTQKVYKTTPNGVRHDLGRTVNILFVHARIGAGYAGEVEAIGNLASADANMFVNSSVGGTATSPLRAQDASIVIETLLHEFGHIVGGRHPSECDQQGERPQNPELMCTGQTPVQLRFGAWNSQQNVIPVLKSALQRCNSQFTSQNSCNNYVVDTVCRNWGDYSTIQRNCIEPNQLAMCSDICTSAQKNAGVVINSLSATIAPNVVDAGSGR